MQWSQYFFEEARHRVSRNQTDILISGDVSIGPQAEQRTPVPGLDILYDNA